MAVSSPPFHLAFPVIDLEKTRAFYIEVLACRVGREDKRWIDFDFFGHQITAHLTDAMPQFSSNSVDDREIPVSHFGVALAWEQWHNMVERMQRENIPFLVEPHIRFAGRVGEQATLFVRDPSGNAIELKAFRDPARLFAR